MADPIIGKISVGDGATFTPSITNDVLSWTNNKNLPNPESLDIVGATFTPSVSNAGVLSWSNNKGLPNPASVDMAQAVVDKKPGWGIPIGYEYFSFNPNIPQGALPLFGGEYSRTTYSDLWAWVQTQTGYLKTEAEWQTLSTSNNGNVPYYSDGDGSTTFRVPSLKCWVKAADGTVSEVGSYLEAGLPNITGSLTIQKMNDGGNTFLSSSGAINLGVDGSRNWGISWLTAQNIATQKMDFDASRNSSVYGNSTTVQPESIVGMWLVKAYGTVVDTGTIDEQQYIDDRIATRLPLTGGTMIGDITFGNNEAFIQKQNTDIVGYHQFQIGWGRPETSGGAEWLADGAKMAFHSYHADNVSHDDGGFVILATDGTNNKTLSGEPNGSLKWGGINVLTNPISATGVRQISVYNNRQAGKFTLSEPSGNWGMCVLVSFVSPTDQSMNRVFFCRGYWTGSSSRTGYYRVPLNDNDGAFTIAVSQNSDTITFTVTAIGSIIGVATILAESSEHPVTFTWTPS